MTESGPSRAAAARENWARAERATLCDLLAELGPDAPTLCTGWRTRDLAAHLIVRERRVDAAPGILLRPIAGHLARVQADYARRPYPQLVEELRHPPRWAVLSAIPLLDKVVNTQEYFIHTEDVRRAQPQWAPRPVPDGLAQALWQRIRTQGRFVLRRFPATITIEVTGCGEVRTGRGGPPVRLRGDAGEIAMFLSGRQRAALVELTGPADLTERLRTLRLGL